MHGSEAAEGEGDEAGIVLDPGQRAAEIFRGEQHKAKLEQAEEGDEVAARRLVNWVRSRLRPQAELAGLKQQLGRPEILARELSPLAIEWAANSKPGDLPWLFYQCMALQPSLGSTSPSSQTSPASRST